MPASHEPPDHKVSRPAVFYWLPLLGIVVIAYAALLYTVGPSEVWKTLDQPLFAISLSADRRIQFSVHDGFIILIFVLLFAEVAKAAIYELRALMNHFLSLALTVFCVYCLLNLEGFGTITFFYITVAAAFDVLAGVYITFRAKPEHEPHIKVKVSRGH
jgi:hypothetical protein